LAPDDAGDHKPVFHYEDGVPVFDPERIDDLAREQEDAKQRDAKYKTDQLAVNRRVMIFTGVLAACSVLTGGISAWQAYIANQTLTEIQKSKADTGRIITASETQADAAKSFAASASKINSGINTAVDKLNLQAEKLEASVKQAARLADATEKANANVINSDRPWIGIVFSVDGFAVGKTPTYSIAFMNSGKRPARVTKSDTVTGFIDYGNNPVYVHHAAGSNSVAVVVPGQAVGSSFKSDTADAMNPITEDAMKALVDGVVPYRVYAMIEYTDIRTNASYWTHACWHYTPKIITTNSGFSNCTEYNDAK
jgi:hypothetical protein